MVSIPPELPKCVGCHQPMASEHVESCAVRYVTIGGAEYERDTAYFDVNERCHDCGILNKPGNVHHVNCDMERCPKCGDQLISCDCDLDDERWA